MVCLGLLVFVLLPAASEGTKKGNQLGSAAVEAGVKPCGPKRGNNNCCGNGKCEGPEDEITCMADCPGVQTTEMCGEEPHSDRAGKGLTFGVSHRAKSAQDCCDKCSASKRGCNSWTFCGYPVCFGLDTGWNHTHGECWLRKLEDPTKPTFGQRGEYTMRYRRKMLRTRRSCTDIDTPGGMSPGWVCPPTHVPWTSGSIGGKTDLAVKWSTGGGWGNMRIHQLAADGTPIEASCNRNGGQPCDPKKLDHGRRLAGVERGVEDGRP